MSYPTFQRDHLADIEGYAESVLSGTRKANRYEILAVQRESADLERVSDPNFPYYFDPAAAIRVIRFIETFPHVKGKWAAAKGTDRLLKLEGWQKWNLAQIFGWKVKATGLRRYTSAYLCVPRKNAKSVIAAGIGLYMLTADEEYGAEVYCGATKEKQAWEVFRPAKKMAEQQALFRGKFGVEVHAKKLERTFDSSRFEPIVGNPGDGSSPSLYIGDEYHEHADDNQRDTMVTGMGAREQPLELLITTAGTNSAGPCALHQQDIQKILEGVLVDETTFGIIYTIDKDDDWKSTDALIKANPNYGVSVGEDFLKNEQQKAIQSSRKQNKFKTKHLNIWCGAKEAWLNGEKLLAAADPELNEEDFYGEVCHPGLDLSRTDDLTSNVRCYDREIDGKKHYYFFGTHYVTEAKAQDNELYQGWIHDGWLNQCDGEMIDYDQVQHDFELISQKVDVSQLFYDPWGASVLAQKISRAMEIEAVEVPQSYRVFAPAMRDFETLLNSGRVHYNGDPVIAWCFSNVIAQETRDGKYMRPVKEGQPNKIDAAVAALMAFIKAYVPDEDNTDNQDYVDLNG